MPVFLARMYVIRKPDTYLADPNFVKHELRPCLGVRRDFQDQIQVPGPRLHPEGADRALQQFGEVVLGRTDLEHPALDFAQIKHLHNGPLATKWKGSFVRM